MTPAAFLKQLRATIEQNKAKPSRQSPSEIAAMLEGAAVFIGGKLVKGRAALGQSKVGGKPDLPSGFEWPCEGDDDDAPLGFVAQLNLAELRSADLGKQLPATGMLWVFSILDGNRAYGMEIDETTTAVRYLARPGTLKPHKLPAQYVEDEDARIVERKIVFGPTVAMPSPDVDVHDVIRKALAKLDGVTGPVSLLRPASPTAFVLASFDGYDVAPDAFGEGVLDVVITKKHLAKHDLGAAECEFESGT
jgi:Domain of unknown function (DUF1963)